MVDNQLQQQITDLEKREQQRRQQIEKAQQTINQLEKQQKQTGFSKKGDIAAQRRDIDSYSREVSQLQNRLNILRDSQSLAEAQSRVTRFEQQQKQEVQRQQAQRDFLRQQRGARVITEDISPERFGISVKDFRSGGSVRTISTPSRTTQEVRGQLPEFTTRQIDTFKDPRTGEKIPISEVVLEDPRTGEQVVATPQEAQQFREFEASQYIASTQPTGFLETFRSNIKQQQTARLRGDPTIKAQFLGGFGGSVGSGFVDVGESTFTLLTTSPKQTIKQLPESLAQQSRYLFGGGFTNDLRTNSQNVLGYAAGLYASSAILGLGISRVAKPIPTSVTKPLRPRKVPQAFERQFTIVSNGKPYQVGFYEILGEVRPPRVTYKTSRLTGLPKDVRVLPAETFVTRTLEPAIQGRPFLVGEVRKGKTLRIQEILGQSEIFNPRVNPLSSNIDQYLLRRFTERQTGKPVSTRTARQFFPREAQFEFSDIVGIKKGKADFVKNELTLISNDFRNLDIPSARLKLRSGKGRTVTRQRAITRTKDFLETELLEIKTAETLFKDVTKPFGRGSGRTPELLTTLEIVKEPIILDTAPITGIRPANIKKTPLSKSLQQEIKQLQKQATPLPKPQIKLPSETLSSTKPILREVPVTQSVYTGLGIYELTEGGISPRLSEPFALPTFTLQPRKSLEIQQEPIIKTIQRESLKAQQKSIIKSVQKEVLKLQPKVVQKEVQKTTQKQAQKLQQKQLQRLLQKPLQKAPITTRPSFFRPPRRPPVFPRFKRKKEDEVFEEVPTFNVIIKRRGKLVTRGSGFTEGKALKQLERALLGSLARTGFIRPTGKTERRFKVDEFGEPDPTIFRDFRIRKGRKVPLTRTFIQRRGKSLTSQLERSLIQQARRSSKKRRRR